MPPFVSALQVFHRQGKESDWNDLVDQPPVCLTLGLLQQGELPDVQGQDTGGVCLVQHTFQ